MADITKLFDSTSLSPPKPAIGNDALGAALLTGMLTDLTVMKARIQAQHEAIEGLFAAGRIQAETNQHQMDSNAAQQSMNEEVRQLFEKHNILASGFNNLVTALLEIDERLNALDGKRSISNDQDQSASVVAT